jgi:carboxymethylenebutenolidase
MTVEVTEIAEGSARARVVAPSEPSGIGVLLYPTIFGVNAAMERFAGELAELGMTVAAWDPYRGEPISDDLMQMVKRSAAVEDTTAIDEVRAIADHMQAELGLRRLGGIGWCFGGRIGLLHAGLDDRIAVLCSYNPTILSPTPVEVVGVGTTSKADLPGQTMDEFELAARIVGPVQVTRPEHDFTQPAEYQTLVDALFRRPAPTFYEYYPGVGHGYSYEPGAENERAHRYTWAGTISLLGSLTDQN